MGLLSSKGEKVNEEAAESKGLNIGGKLKLLILVAVLLGGSVGASGGATVYGFTHGAVTISDTFQVNAAAATGSFWVELENRGLFPLTLDVTFELRTVKGGLDLGSQTASFKLGPRGSDNQTLTYALTPELMAALTNGALLTFTPSAKGTYAWFVKISEKELEDEQLTVVRVNSRPTISDILVSPAPVEAGEEATIQVVAQDPDNDRLTLEYNLDGGSLLGVSENGMTMTWQAPYQVGNFTFRARASDGIDLSDWSQATLRVVDTEAPTISLTSRPDLDGRTMTYVLESDEPLLGAPEASLEFKSAGNGTGYSQELNLDPTGPNQWQTAFDTNSSGEYEVDITATDYVGNLGEATAITTLDLVSLLADSETVVEGGNLSLTVTGGTGVNLTEAVITITEIPRTAPMVPEEVAAVGRFIEIEAPTTFKAGLESAILVVNYDDEDIAAVNREGLTEGDLKIYFYNESQEAWERQETLVDTVNRTLTATLDHLSLFGIFGENVAPSAEAGADMKGEVGRELTFTASAKDVDGEVVLYEWDFDGDGHYDVNLTIPTVTHSYAGPGEYTARLRVTDDGGATGFDTLTVTIASDSQSPGWSLPAPGLALILGGLVLAVGLSQGRRRQG